jgi:hypothetical protein
MTDITKVAYTAGNGTLSSDEVRAQWDQENEINKALMPNAGKVPLDEKQSCGRGIVKEIRECIGGWWVAVSTIYLWSCIWIRLDVDIKMNIY